MRKRLLLTLMSLFLVLSTQSIAEENALAKHLTGSRIEHVEKVDSVQAVSMNKKIALKNCTVLLTSEVEDYIESKVGKKIKTHDISKHIVKESLDNDIDICFVLAQAEIETAFGTTGIGKSRRSVYGVYITFKNHNASTTHYINLLKKNYLGTKKTIHHLMKNFVNLNGHRYSSDKNYEGKLKKKYLEIKNNTKISKLQDECNKYKS